MGLTFSGNEVVYDSITGGFESILTRSLSPGGNARSTVPFRNKARSTPQSMSFNGRDSESSVRETSGHDKLLDEGSVSLSGSDMDSLAFSVQSTKSDEPKNSRSRSHARKRSIDLIDNDTPKHEAAVKLQKVYKSFRTRRQLADCAVLVEQRWWKLLDFALLKRNSVSFFDIDKHESAVSRWSRAKSRAAKVGKGLSKDEKAQKLALQHWLEAIDARHRYGHNLQFYYECWLQCESMEPFFYWLDVGEGKEVNLELQCARWKLQQQCIKYLGPKERDAYEVVIEDGKFIYKQSRQVLDTSGEQKDSKWIFVLSTSKKLYVGQKKKGTFQHSSFLAGGATSSAGRLVVEDGVIKAVWPHSGHYQPTEENFQEFMSFLEENNVDLTDVKKSPAEEDDELSIRLRNLSDTNLFINSEIREEETSDDAAEDTEKMAGKEGESLPAPDHEESEEEANKVGSENSSGSDDEGKQVLDQNPSSTDDEQHYIFRKKNLFLWDQSEDEAASVTSELILGRINSKKGIRSYQLGKQLSSKWTTGAGARIGFVRDYPSELQFRSLEQVSLSPRSSPNSSRFASPRITQSGSPTATDEAPANLQSESDR